MGASGIPAHTVFGPIGVFHQVPVCGFIAVINKIAGFLPAENIPRGISPGDTGIILVPFQKIQVEAAVIEPPVLPFTLSGKFPETDAMASSRLKKCSWSGAFS
jgi:hypothetical protein